MSFVKNGKKFNVTENENTWIVSRADAGLSVSYKVSKNLCATKDELVEYVNSNDMF